MTSIAVAGSTGKLAVAIIRHLLSKPGVTVHGICRTPSKMPADLSSNSQVKLFAAGADDTDKIREGIRGTSAVICCYLGDNRLMEEGQYALIDACIAERVPRYFASDWAFDYRGLAPGEHPSKDPMKKVQAYLERRAGEIAAVHVLNGAFLQTMLSFAPYYDAKERVMRYWGSGYEPIEMTTYDDAAKLTAEAALDPEAKGFLSILGDSLSPRQWQKDHKEVYGEELRLERMGSLEDWRQSYQKALKETPENIYSWIQGAYGYHMANGTTYMPRPLTSEKYGIKAMTMKEYMQKTPKEMLKKAVFLM